jgi:prepilin-type N-terminal cleavage/methylation domain-containing protein
MKINFNRGFTLIELLVVIAIIGILASVVLASLNTARDKGADAALKAGMSQMTAQAELFYDNGRTYAGLCASGANTPVARILANINANADNSSALNITYATGGTGANTTCHDTAAAWAVEAPLKSHATAMWCVDSTGFSGQTAASSLGVSDHTCN